MISNNTTTHNDSFFQSLRDFSLTDKRKIKKERKPWVRFTFLLAQGEGFEPSWLLAKRFSRPPRYDRFDTPAY